LCFQNFLFVCFTSMFILLFFLVSDFGFGFHNYKKKRVSYRYTLLVLRVITLMMSSHVDNRCL
jgi:hypothetical protein